MEEYRNSEKFDSHGHRLERCLAFGEEAEYWISIGAGRQITREECIETMERNIADGLVVQAGYTRNTAILCSCHSDCCGVLSHYRATSLEDWQASPISNNVSDYLLQYDKDSCLQCGACAERCPMVAIAMDEDGFPAVDEYCVRCGQCGLVCPVGARTLTARPENDRMPVPDNHMDDHNRKFGYRVQHGLA